MMSERSNKNAKPNACAFTTRERKISILEHYFCFVSFVEESHLKYPSHMMMPWVTVFVGICLIKFWQNNVIYTTETSCVPILDVITGLILVLLYVLLIRVLNYLKWKKLKNRAALKRNGQDLVILYIWFPLNWVTFGHVSLEIQKYGSYERKLKRGTSKKNLYMSFGPREYPLPVGKYFKRNKILIMDNYEEDVKDMEREADVILHFYTLDTQAMQSKIGILNKLIAKRRICYGLLRRISKYQRRPTSYTCVAAVMEVFHAGGGLSKLFNITDDKICIVKNSFDAVKNSLSRSRKISVKLLSMAFGVSEAHAFEIYTTPTAFAQIVKQAKTNELIMLKGVFEADRGWLPWKDETGNIFVAFLRILIEVLVLSYLLPASTNFEWRKIF